MMNTSIEKLDEARRKIIPLAIESVASEEGVDINEVLNLLHWCVVTVICELVPDKFSAVRMAQEYGKLLLEQVNKSHNPDPVTEYAMREH